MAIEPIIQENGFPQESLLVEIRSISGYSGSPVFLYISPQTSYKHLSDNMRKMLFKQFPMIREKRQAMYTGWGPMLLGVGYCYIRSEMPVKSATTRRPVFDHYVDSNTGMMGVIPFWKLKEIMYSEKLKPVIAAAEAELHKRMRESAVVLTSASDSASISSGPTASEASAENPNH
jgi:hypothetical protein